MVVGSEFVAGDVFGVGGGTGATSGADAGLEAAEAGAVDDDKTG
jgi:hypothetical protein